MKVVLSLPFFLLTISAITRFRLNTAETVQLNVGDQLISTLGLFTATLLQTQCMLSISTFNGNNGYVKVGNYTSSNYTGNCKYLNITDGQVVTDTNSTYMYVGPNYNLTTILTIDDIGIIRLIGTYQLPDYKNQASQEFVVTDFQKTQTYIFPVSNLAIGFLTSFPTLTNSHNWQFSASMGQLRIQQGDNPGIAIAYSYANIDISNSQIKDFTQNTFPSAIFPNITFYPRCLQPRLYLNYKPPFVLVISPDWPIATVYEQGRYKILEVSYSQVYQPYAWQQTRRLFTRKEGSVCPPYTFQFNGNCVVNCPYPYYHELRGQNGYCVLTCEQFTPSNTTTRICSCYTDYEAAAVSISNVQSCPNNTSPYPYGCYCTDSNLYFDRLLTLSCVSTCPSKTYPSNGLCMDCPAQCLSCKPDGLFRSFFECKVCAQGFTLTQGQCYKTCSPGLGMSVIQGACSPCSDPNCLSCSSDVNVCTRCGPIYAVSGGACLSSCDNTSALAVYEKLSARCLPLDASCAVKQNVRSTYYRHQPMIKCVQCPNGQVMHLNKCMLSCPANFVANPNNFCYCSSAGTLQVNDQCLSLPMCPIKLGWDPLSWSCMSCSFGCMTCYNLECTSCVPGYFLYVSPQGVICRRSSPLYPCDGQYSWINGACVLTMYSNPLYILTQCLGAVANCMACGPNSDTDCAICNPGYYNVNNTCISNCPGGSIPYKGLTCILTEIANCSIPYLQVKYDAFILNQAKIANSQPYNFYIFNGNAQSNDPVGYIHLYQQLTQRKNDGTFRDSQFFYPTWTCLKCNPGFGMNDNFTLCLPCPASCITCYMASNSSCLTFQNVVPPLSACKYYIDYNTQTCVQSCAGSSVIPYVLNGKLYCYPLSLSPTKTISNIDSSAFQNADGSTNVFFVLDHGLDVGTSVTLSIIRSSHQALQGQKSRLMADASSNVQTVSLTGQGYIYYHDSVPTNNVWILNASGNLMSTAGSSGVALSSPTYGVQLSQGYNVYRQTWLAYIGYIMSFVIICLHVVYIGNDLLYKVDNTLILAQSIFYFSYAQLLVGQLLSQFYYGWLFAQFGFFPNFFVNTIPSTYVEVAAPNSYKLNNVDANIVRNAGWAFSLLLVFLGAYGIITLVCWLISTVLRKPDVWHPRIAANALIGFIQFLSMNVFYWCVANLLHIGNSGELSSSFRQTSIAVSVLFLVLIIGYTLFRWFFNPLGGLYMSKRILIATILAASYQNTAMLAPLVLLQVVFLVFRYFLQNPDRTSLGLVMVGESVLHIVTYILLYLVLSPGTNTIVISLIIFLMVVVLMYGLTHVYLESQNEWEIEEKEGSEGSVARAEVDRHVSNMQKY